jgi:hypothetical protein
MTTDILSLSVERSRPGKREDRMCLSARRPGVSFSLTRVRCTKSTALRTNDEEDTRHTFVSCEAKSIRCHEVPKCPPRLPERSPSLGASGQDVLPRLAGLQEDTQPDIHLACVQSALVTKCQIFFK